MNEEIYLNMNKHTEYLSNYATKNDDAIYLKPLNKDIRTTFFRDIDKVLYSLSFIRYMGKTQVFSIKNNDHIQTRMIHVQYVSKIARTIARALNLNEDLTESIALGHDLGHTPFGHAGEKILNKLSIKHGEGNFLHNVNSVRQLLYIENYGKGFNISLQVLDGIMAHNGEILSKKIVPVNKDFNLFLNEYNNAYKSMDDAKKIIPMTLEGCIVRVSDVIAYIGRDLEDGIRMNLITWDDVPINIKNILGFSNSEIVNTLICDVIKNSFDKPYISFSDDVFNALSNLLKFNYEYIYNKTMESSEIVELEKKFNVLFDYYLDALNNEDETSSIYYSFLKHMDSNYLHNTKERIIIDYISGMTDDYFNEQYVLAGTKNVI